MNIYVYIFLYRISLKNYFENFNSTSHLEKNILIEVINIIIANIFLRVWGLIFKAIFDPKYPPTTKDKAIITA